MTEKSNTNLSKYLSYILRHHPEDVKLQLQDGGWVETWALINNINQYSKYNIDIEKLKSIVDTDNKQRYSFKEDYKYIRANQGHSIKNLDMHYKEVTPPESLYHGTSEKSLNDIIKSGELKPMSRQLVHLSKDIETAKNVGSRHGKVVVLKIKCQEMIKDKIKFYQSENGVYLVEKVESKYFEVLN